MLSNISYSTLVKLFYHDQEADQDLDVAQDPTRLQASTVAAISVQVMLRQPRNLEDQPRAG